MTRWLWMAACAVALVVGGACESDDGGESGAGGSGGGGATGAGGWTAGTGDGRVIEAGSSGYGGGPTAGADDGSDDGSGAATSMDLRGTYAITEHEIVREDCTVLTLQPDALIGRKMGVKVYQEGADLYAVFATAEAVAGDAEPMGLFGTVGDDGSYQLAAERSVADRGSGQGGSYTMTLDAAIETGGTLTGDANEGTFTLAIDVSVDTTAAGRTETGSGSCHIETSYRGRRITSPEP